jgi:hypothetical protein
MGQWELSPNFCATGSIGTAAKRAPATKAIQDGRSAFIGCKNKAPRSWRGAFNKLFRGLCFGRNHFEVKVNHYIAVKANLCAVLARDLDGSAGNLNELLIDMVTELTQLICHVLVGDGSKELTAESSLGFNLKFHIAQSF